MGVRRATVDDAEAIERIRVETWRATYRGLLPDGLIDQLQPNVERRRERLRSPAPYELNFMTEERARVVGYAIAGPKRSPDREYPGGVFAIYVLPTFQGSTIDLVRRPFSLTMAAWFAWALLLGTSTRRFIAAQKMA